MDSGWRVRPGTSRRGRRPARPWSGRHRSGRASTSPPRPSTRLWSPRERTRSRCLGNSVWTGTGPDERGQGSRGSASRSSPPIWDGSRSPTAPVADGRTGARPWGPRGRMAEMNTPWAADAATHLSGFGEKTWSPRTGVSTPSSVSRPSTRPGLTAGDPASARPDAVAGPSTREMLVEGSRRCHRPGSPRDPEPYLPRRSSAGVAHPNATTEARGERGVPGQDHRNGDYWQDRSNLDGPADPGKQAEAAEEAAGDVGGSGSPWGAVDRGRLVLPEAAGRDPEHVRPATGVRCVMRCGEDRLHPRPGDPPAPRCG